MKKAALRWIRRLLVLGACAWLLAVVVHTPWARGLVLHQLTSRLSARTGFVISADAIDYDLLALKATVDGLQISRPGSQSAPILRVRQARIALSPRILSGAIEADSIEADGVALVIDLAHPTGTRAAAAGPSGPFSVPAFTVGRVVMRHVDVDLIDADRIGHLTARDATLELEGGGPRRLEGTIVVAGGLMLDNDDTHARIDRFEGRAFLDGDTIGVKPSLVVAGTHHLALDGSLTITGPSPRFDLGIVAEVDVAQMASWFPALPGGDGSVRLQGRVTGPLDDPRLAYSARTAGVTMPDIRLPATTAEGSISRAGIYVERLRTGIGEGWIEVTGRLPFGPDDPDSRFSLRWADVSIASLAQVFPLMPKDHVGMVSTGSARVHWPGMALAFSTVAGEATSDLRFAPHLPPARVGIEGAAARWALRGEQELDGGTRARLDATITVSAADLARSPILGTLRLSSSNLQLAMSDARQAFAGLPDVPAWLQASPLTLDGTIDGTLGEPRLGGRAVSNGLHFTGVPALNASATFAADATGLTVSTATADDGAGNRLEGNAAVAFDVRKTKGTFAASVENPESWLDAVLGRVGNAASAGALKIGGAVKIDGKWDGPLSDPVVSMTARATDVTVESPAMSAERVTAEGRLDGPVSSPEATVRISAGVVRATGMQPALADAQFSLKAGRIEAAARVPDWSASLRGHLSTAAPHEFAAALSIEGFTAPRLLALIGGQQDAGWTADGTVSATFEAAGRLDDQSLYVRGQATLAGGAVRAGERRILEGVDAVVDMRDGRLWVTRLSGLGLGGPLSASGDFPLSWIGEYLPAGWRVDESAAPRRPASFELRAEPDVKTLGAWLRPDEPGAITGALRLRLSGTASAASIGALDGRVVVEPDTVTVRDVAFTLPRAASIRIINGRANVEDLTVTTAGTTASVSGSIGLTGDRPIDAGITASGALDFLASVVPGRLAGAFNATFKATGPAADPQLSGRLSLDNAAWEWPEQRIALRDWTAEVVATAHTIAIEKLTGHVNGGEANVSGAVTFGGAGAGLTLTSGRLDITARAPDWSATFDGHMAAEAPHAFSATLSITDVAVARLEALTGAWEPEYVPDGTLSATIDATGALGSRTLRVGGQATLVGGSLSVGGSRVIDGVRASVETRDGRVWLTNFTGLGTGGPLSASGDLPLSWIGEYLPAGWRAGDGAASQRPASFEMSAQPDLETLGTWLRPKEPRRISGGMRLRLTGTASAPSAEALDARLVIEPGTVTIRDVAFTLPHAESIRITNGRASVEDLTVTTPGTTASVSGSIGLTGDRPIDAGITASGAMGFLSSFVPGRMAGAFHATFKATGPAANPQLSGRLSLDNAAWVWPEQRIAFRDWTGEAVATADTVTIDTLTGHLNGGEAEVTGTVTFGGTSSAGLTMRVRDAFVEAVRGFRSHADADLKLASTREGARLSGNVTVTSGAYREPITAMARLFSAARTAPAATAGAPNLLGAVSLDVGLTASSPIVIENSAGRLDLVPSLKFQGSLEEPVLLGTLDMVDEGRLSLLGRSFRLTEGRVTFPGTGDPTARLIGETRVGDYAVTLRMQGPVANLEATYTSDPPLSQRDVQSLLVTGRTTDTAGTRSSDTEEFVLGAASSDLLGLAGQMVGLDSVQLGRGDFELGSSDVNPAMRLTVTKSISARSRLILSQDLDNNKLTWIVVLTPRRGYEIRLSQRDNAEEVVEFRQELLLGPGVSPPSTSRVRGRASGPRVRALEFAGELGHPVSELESVVRLRPPKEFDASTWQADRARLEAFYRDHGHALARIVPERTVVNDDSVGHVLLRYRVDPGPRTVLSVSGIHLSDDESRALMLLWSNSVLPEFFYDDVTRHLRGLLAERGYLRPSIAVTLDEPVPGVVAANVAVAPGQATITRRLVIEGARAVPEPELRAALSGSPALADAWLDPAPLMAAVAAIYAERGYPSASVSAGELVFDGTAAERRLRVIEGPQAVVTDIVLTGVPDARTADARSAIALQAGQPLLPGTEAGARRGLRRFYLDRGFRSATVRSASKGDPDGRVALTFVVNEGPVSIVDAVAVKGLDATRPSVADRVITLRPGEPAGQQAVSETQRRLYGLGVFRSADISVEPAPGAPAAADAATVPVTTTVSLEEARRFRLRYGIQVSNQYGPAFDDFTSAIGVAGDIRDRNFLRRAFTLGASFRLEKNLQSLRGQFSLPPLLNQRLQTNYFATIRSEIDASEQSATYTNKERDFTFEQRLRLPRHMEVSWGYSYNVRDVTFDIRPPSESTRLQGTLATLNGTFIFDARDQPFDASRGWFQSSNLQWGTQALGSDLDYVRVLLRQFYYHPAGPFILASGVRWGWLHSIGGEVPVTILDRFFDAGGSQTVRGYAEDSLSAIEILGAPVGGTKVLILNQEVRFPLFSRWLQGAAFVDAGNTFAPKQSITLDKLAVGVGFGIRIMTPFAPIRIDLGYPLNRRPEDRPYRIYFSIGQIF